MMIDRFRNKDNIIWEMGNEVSPPLGGEFGKEIGTKWYEEMYKFIREKYKGILLTGVADPNSIDYDTFDHDESFMTTVHQYKHEEEHLPKNIKVIGEEYGATQKLFNRDFKKSDQYFHELIIQSLKRGVENGVARLGSLFVWHADKNHKDNLGFTPEIYPQTVSLIKELSPKLKKMFT
jgi:hypothetical protein